MKKGLVFAVVTLLSFTLAGNAFAGPFGRFQRPARQQQRPAQEETQQNEAPRNEKNGSQARNGPGEGGNGAQFQTPQNGRMGGGRMSVEDRQRLRRQINEAGRSLYPQPPSK